MLRPLAVAAILMAYLTVPAWKSISDFDNDRSRCARARKAGSEKARAEGESSRKAGRHRG